jgi:serine/threonine protein kinase
MSSHAVQAPVQPGDVLAEKYVVERILGAGTMGVVVAAKHVQLGERVALKFLRREIAERSDVVARFLREAQTGARIKGEHTARILDVGTMEGGLPYMVMEFLEGRDLHELISERGRLPIQEAIEYVVQACVALAEAHAAGVVHRDLKPSNLFLTRRPDGSPLIKVLDFGISKVAPQVGVASDPGGADERLDLTRTDDVIGSPMYMSPEHARSARSVDSRTDIWSLGVILHQLLAGEPPFGGESVAELLSAILVSPPRQLTLVRCDVPAALEAVVLRCLEKDVGLRMPTVADLARALAPWARDDTRVLIARATGTISVPTPEPMPSISIGARSPTEPLAGGRTGRADVLGPAGAAGTSMGWQPQGGVRPKRSRLLLAAMVVVGIAGIASLAIGFSHRSTTQPAPSEAAGDPPKTSGSQMIDNSAVPALVEELAPSPVHDTPSASFAAPAPVPMRADLEKPRTVVPSGRAHAGNRPPAQSGTGSEKSPVAPTPATTHPPSTTKRDFRSLIDERH